MRARTGERVVEGALGGMVIFWVLWFLVKLAAIPFLILSIINLVAAVQHGAAGTFDYGPLIISAAVFLLL